MADDTVYSIRCGHCDRAMLGNAYANGWPLCHPDAGLDCYHLVTVWKHETPCRQCRHVRLVLDRQGLEAPGRVRG